MRTETCVFSIDIQIVCNCLSFVREILHADFSLFVFLDNFITAKMESKFSTIPLILQEERNQQGNIMVSDEAKTPKENIVVSDHLGTVPKGKRRKRKTHYPAPHLS